MSVSDKNPDELPVLSNQSWFMPERYELGEWLLIDGKTECQYIHSAGNELETVDINGMWSDVRTSRLSKRVYQPIGNYSNFKGIIGSIEITKK